MTTTTTPEERAAAVALLRRVEARLTKGWTRRALARDRWGHRCDPYSARACRFCLLGALAQEWPSFPRLLKVARGALDEAVGQHPLDWFNDVPGRKKSEVLAAVRAARERLESQDA